MSQKRERLMLILLIDSFSQMI